MNSSSQRRTDQQIARIASRQGGTIARWQLLRLGLTANDIQYRITIGRLRVIHRGVYAVGHDAIPVRGRLFAALLLARQERGLSHAAATALHKLIPSVPPIIDVTVTAGRPRDRPGVVFHKAATLELTTKHGLPVTSVARTLQDLAATDSPHLRKAVNQAFVKRLVTPDELRRRTGPGAAILKRLAGLAVRDLVVIRVTDEQVDHDLPATIDRLERWFAGPGAMRAGPAPAPARRGGTRRTR